MEEHEIAAGEADARALAFLDDAEVELELGLEFVGHFGDGFLAFFEF